MEEKQTRRWANILLGLIILGVIGFFSYGFFVVNKPGVSTSGTTSGAEPTPTIALFNYISYQGHVGFNALELLKAKATVEESVSGLVVAINGRKADNYQQEYWAFYVNGKLSTVGPMQYQTKEGDLIEWKIEKY